MTTLARCCRCGGQVLRRVRLLLGVRTVAARLLAPGKPVPGTRGEDSAAVLLVHPQQPERVSVPEPQGPRVGGHVQRDPVHAHVLHYARVPGGRRPAVVTGDRAPVATPVRRQRDNHRLGTRFRSAVHAGRGQHSHGGQGDGPTDKRVAGEHNVVIRRCYMIKVRDPVPQYWRIVQLPANRNCRALHERVVHMSTAN